MNSKKLSELNENDRDNFIPKSSIPTYEEVIKMREDYMKNWRKINPDYPENDYYSGVNDGLFLFYNKLKG